MRQNIRRDVSRFCRDVIQVLTPSEWIHRFHYTEYKTDAVADTVSHQFKHFIYKFRINILQILQQFFIHKTVSFNNRHNPFVHCAFLLAMTTSIRKVKHLQRMSDRCSVGGIIWQRSVFSSVVIPSISDPLSPNIRAGIFTGKN